jgi:hypothetical protein
MGVLIFGSWRGKRRPIFLRSLRRGHEVELGAASSFLCLSWGSSRGHGKVELGAAFMRVLQLLLGSSSSRGLEAQLGVAFRFFFSVKHCQ